MVGVGALVAAGALIGAAVAFALIGPAIRNAPDVLLRNNVSGRSVPAALGVPLALGAFAGLLLLVALDAAGAEGAAVGPAGAATAFLVGLMGGAGAWDDRRGDERARGFSGHLQALRSGRVTGGSIKIAAGAAGGLIAGVLVADGIQILEVALLCALTANLINLTDRAPGRAAKVSLVLAVPLVAIGSPMWALASSGLLGGLVTCLPVDLSERAMLGDAGSNPVGAVLGLGLALSLPEPPRLAALVVVALLNLVSERRSFSTVIEKSPVLSALDRLGRRNFRA